MRATVAEHAGIREVLEQRHDVGEGLVERQHVGVDRLVEARMHSVEQRMGGLVGDDVVRQAGEDERAGGVVGVLDADREVAEQQRLLGRAVVGVAVAHGVGVDAQPADEVGLERRAFAAARGPQRHPAERLLEVADGVHRHRVDHLLVELRVGLRRRQPVRASTHCSLRSTGL